MIKRTTYLPPAPPPPPPPPPPPDPPRLPILLVADSVAPISWIFIGLPGNFNQINSSHKVYKCYTAPVCVITFKDNHELSKYIFFYTTYQRDWMSGPQITIIWFQQLDWNKLQIYRPRAWHKIVSHLPSKGTLLYWVIAFCASRRLSNTTSAVPIDLPDLS